MKLKPILYTKNTFFVYLFLFMQLNINAQILNTNLESLSKQVDSLIKTPQIPQNFPYAQSLKKESVKIKADKLEANILEWIGIYHRRQEEYELALASFFQLHHIGELNSDSALLCLSNFELGATFQTINKKEKALTYLDKAYKLANALDNQKLIAYIFNEYGILYSKEGNYEKALEYLVLAKKITANFKYSLRFLPVDSNLGVAYALTGKPHKALITFIDFHKYHKENGDSLLYAEDYGNIAFAYQKMGKIREALMYYDSSIYYATKFHQNKVASITYQDLSNAYAEMGNTSKAFDAYKKYHQLEKVAISESTQQRISALEVAFETAKKERELKLAQNKIAELKYLAQIRLQRIFLVTASLLVLLITGIFLYARLKEKLKRRAIEEKLVIAALENKQLEAENLKQRLANKKADLTAISLNINKKEDFLTLLVQQLRVLKSAIPDTFHQQIQSIINFCNANFGVNDKLSLQHENIGKINHAFFQKLEQEHGKLTPNEKYLAGSFRLGFSNKDVANQKGISVNAVKMGRYRLRKKLQLSEAIDLVDYLQKI